MQLNLFIYFYSAYIIHLSYSSSIVNWAWIFRPHYDYVVAIAMPNFFFH